MTKPRKFVVGVDGSAQSEAALRWALDEAAPGRDTVRAVLVRARPDLLPGTSYAIQPHGRKPTDQDEDYAALLRTTIDKQLAQRACAPEIETVVAVGDPATELIKESGDADLLAIGSHGASPVAELLLGGVATRCVRHSRCPVVVLTADAARRAS